jgi:hypothetical protein
MNKGKIIVGVISVFCTLPIWFYLLYKILVMVGATELMMFLFWIYLPAVLVANILGVIATSDK